MLYADDGSRAGAILPFGGDQGYKSFGLGFMVGILASAFGNPIWDRDGLEGMTNGTWLLAIRIDAMMDTDAFLREMEAMAEYACSSEPGADRAAVSGCRDSYREFPVREPSTEALLRHNGLLG